MSYRDLDNRVQEFRQRAGLTQEALAEQVGVTRQTLVAIEGGRSVPSTAVALRLGRALGCQVEDLFFVERDAPRLHARVPRDTPLAHEPGLPARVVLGRVQDRWVAHPMDPQGESWLGAADALLDASTGTAGPAQVEPLAAVAELERNLLVVGCAPALGVLARHAEERAPGSVRVRWVQGSSGRALDLLARGEVHVAGLHLRDPKTGEFNVPFVRRRLKGQSVLVVTLAEWDAGLVVAAGNPLGLRGAADLARPKLRVVRREAGAGATALLERLLREAGRPPLAPGPGAAGHHQVARLVAMGLADAGVAISSAAAASGLAFVPLAQERFDLVVPAALARDPRVARLLETLAGRAFKRDLAGLGGYRSERSGTVVAQVGRE